MPSSPDELHELLKLAIGDDLRIQFNSKINAVMISATARLAGTNSSDPSHLRSLYIQAAPETAMALLALLEKVRQECGWPTLSEHVGSAKTQ